MALVEKLKQAKGLTDSIEKIDSTPRFETLADFPGVVAFGNERVFNFIDIDSANAFVSFMNEQMDNAFALEKEKIEVLAKEIFEPKANGAIIP